MKQPKSKLSQVLEGLEPLTPEVVEKIKNEADLIAKRFREGPPPPKDERIGTCRVCQGKIIAKMSREYRGDPRHMIVGPGSRDQMTTKHHGFHCTGCGLKYEFIPESIVVPEDT